MKNSILIAVMSGFVLSTTPVFAQPAAPADKETQAKASAPNVAEFDKQMAQAQENMKKMQEQMDKIRQTQDPQERQKLLQGHWATMQGNMQMMHGMGGGRHDELLCRRPDDGARQDGWPDDGMAGLFETHAGANETAPVHDGPPHGHAANDDGPDDATPAVHVAEVRAAIRLDAWCGFAEHPRIPGLDAFCCQWRCLITHRIHNC